MDKEPIGGCRYGFLLPDGDVIKIPEHCYIYERMYSPGFRYPGIDDSAAKLRRIVENHGGRSILLEDGRNDAPDGLSRFIVEVIGGIEIASGKERLGRITAICPNFRGISTANTRTKKWVDIQVDMMTKLRLYIIEWSPYIGDRRGYNESELFGYKRAPEKGIGIRGEE